MENQSRRRAVGPPATAPGGAMTTLFSKMHSSIGSVRPRIAASALPPKRVTEISLFLLELGLSGPGEEERRAAP